MLSAKLIDHFQNPRNVGELPPPAHTVEVMNPACGDILRLSVRWDGDRAAEVRYKVRGCTASVGVGSALAEWMRGRTRSEFSGLKAADVEALVDELIPESRHAAVLALDAVKALLRLV
jgi:nitrogen fixation NifU-like protein